MTRMEDALINRISEAIAFEHPYLNFSEKRALLDMVVKLMDPIIYHVMGNQQSAIRVIDSLANLISPENEDQIPSDVLREMVLSAKEDIMITPSWVSLPLSNEDCYITARVLLGPSKVNLYITYRYAYLDPEGNPVHHRMFSLSGSEVGKYKNLITISCKELKEDYEEGIKFLAKHSTRPADTDLKDTVRERLATVIIKEFYAYDKDSKLRLFHLVDKLTPTITQHIMTVGDRIEWIPRELGDNYMFRAQAEPLVSIIEWALDNMSYTPLIYSNNIVIPIDKKDIHVTVTVTTGQPKVVFFGFPKTLIVGKSLYPLYSWSCTMTGTTNSCGTQDPDAIVKTLEEKVAERMSKEEVELNEARELLNEMLRGGSKKP
jgi:phosphoribosylformylglycinamidine (FGAM) synthase PurS component